VAASRAMLYLPQPAVRRERQTVWRSMTAGPRLRRRQIRVGERVGADDRRGLGRFRIARRIDQESTERALLSGHRVAGSGLAVERQAQDLAERLVGILRGRHPLAIADRQKQVAAVGRKGDLGAELAAAALRHLTPEYLQSLEA